MGRRASREAAVKMLFQFEFQKDKKESQMEVFMTCEEFMRSVEQDYLIAVVNGVNAHIGEIDKLICADMKESWSIDRISRIELSILRVCIYELVIQKSISLQVAANEAVELAKKFGSETSASFINGLMGSIGGRQETI